MLYYNKYGWKLLIYVVCGIPEIVLWFYTIIAIIIKQVDED